MIVLPTGTAQLWLILIKDSDSEVELPRRRGPPKGRGGSSAGAVNPEECKQQ
jgi:hypothetical protein